jgi:hypothetical protein
VLRELRTLDPRVFLVDKEQGRVRQGQRDRDDQSRAVRSVLPDVDHRQARGVNEQTQHQWNRGHPG